MAPLPPSAPPQWHIVETYKGLISVAIEGLKMLALVNGGAAVAVLTYLGNLATHSGRDLPNIKPALLCYCGGLFATVLAFIAAYITQLRLYREEIVLIGGGSLPRRHQFGIAIGCMLATFAAFA